MLLISVADVVLILVGLLINGKIAYELKRVNILFSFHALSIIFTLKSPIMYIYLPCFDRLYKHRSKLSTKEGTEVWGDLYIIPTTILLLVALLSSTKRHSVSCEISIISSGFWKWYHFLRKESLYHLSPFVDQLGLIGSHQCQSLEVKEGLTRIH